jgi:hypothetical protein
MISTTINLFWFIADYVDFIFVLFNICSTKVFCERGTTHNDAVPSQNQKQYTKGIQRVQYHACTQTVITEELFYVVIPHASYLKVQNYVRTIPHDYPTRTNYWKRKITYELFHVVIIKSSNYISSKSQYELSCSMKKNIRTILWDKPNANYLIAPTIWKGLILSLTNAVSTRE